MLSASESSIPMTSHSKWQNTQTKHSTRNWLARSSYFRIFLPSRASTILSGSNSTVCQNVVACCGSGSYLSHQLCTCHAGELHHQLCHLCRNCFNTSWAKLQLLKGWALDAFLMTKMGNRWKSEAQWKYQQGAATLVLPTTNHTWFEKI